MIRERKMLDWLYLHPTYKQNSIEKRDFKKLNYLLHNTIHQKCLYLILLFMIMKQYIIYRLFDSVATKWSFFIWLENWILCDYFECMYTYDVKVCVCVSVFNYTYTVCAIVAKGIIYCVDLNFLFIENYTLFSAT